MNKKRIIRSSFLIIILMSSPLLLFSPFPEVLASPDIAVAYAVWETFEVLPCIVNQEIDGPPDQVYNECSKDDDVYIIGYNTSALIGATINKVYANITYYGTVSGDLNWYYNSTAAGLTFTVMTPDPMTEGGSAGSPLTETFNLTSIRASWTINDLNNTEIQFMNNDAGGPQTAYVDALYLTIEYTPATPTKSLTTYIHTGINDLLVNGSSKANGTSTVFNLNEVANITSLADSGYIFRDYNGSITDNPYYLTMDQDYEIHAYTLKTYNLTVYLHTGISQLLLNGSSKSNGTLTTYNISQVANITSIAASGYIFDDYNGSITDNPYYLTMDNDYEIHAYANVSVSDVSTLEIFSDLDSLFSSQVIYLTGNHTDGSIGISGTTLTFQRSSDNSSWTNILNQTTDSLGYSQIGYAQDEAGTWYFRVLFPGDGTYTAKNSSSIEIDLKQISGKELEGQVPGPPPKEEPIAIGDIISIPPLDPSLINFIMIVILSFIVLIIQYEISNLKGKINRLKGNQ